MGGLRVGHGHCGTGSSNDRCLCGVGSEKMEAQVVRAVALEPVSVHVDDHETILCWCIVGCPSVLACFRFVGAGVV